MKEALTANPHKAGLPTQQQSAPNANALKISVPVLIPPSTCTPILPLAASTHSGNASIVAVTPSNWRPPWLLTTTPSHTYSTASSVSSAVNTPMIHICIFVIDFNHGISRAQLWVSSLNATNIESCFWVRIFSVVISMIGNSSPSGVRKSLRHSLYRTPNTGESAVRKMAVQPCASALRTIRSCMARSFIV